MTSALILEDETLVAEQLRDKLSLLWPDLEIVGMPTEGREALRLARKIQPDIAFLDICLPGLSGLEVAAALPSCTQVVFVTAHDEFAVEAFRAAAVDYLLKPVNSKHLQSTIERLRQGNTQNRESLLALLREIGTGCAHSYLQWIRAGLGDTTVLVPVDEVIYFRSDNKYTSVVTREHQHLVRRSLSQLELQLDPGKFWRIHRGIIVRVDQIVSARRDLRGRYILKLKERSEKLRSSETFGHLFKHM